MGVIGTGRMGRLRASICLQHPAVTTVLVCGADFARARAVGDELGAQAAADVDRMLTGVDAVIVATDSARHADLVEAALAAGIPTFCEKPLTLDLGASERIAAIVADTGARVQVGFQRRFDPGYVAVREVVRSGRLGLLHLVRATSHDHRPVEERFVARSGGLFRDLMLHDLDLVHFVTGEGVVEVHAYGASLVDERFARHGDVDVACASLRLGSGALATVTATRHQPYGLDVRFEVLGSADAVVVGHDEHTPVRRHDGPPTDRPLHDFRARFGEAFARETDAFVRFARDGGTSPCSVAEATAALRVAAACDRSRSEGRPVPIGDAA